CQQRCSKEEACAGPQILQATFSKQINQATILHAHAPHRLLVAGIVLDDRSVVPSLLQCRPGGLCSQAEGAYCTHPGNHDWPIVRCHGSPRFITIVAIFPPKANELLIATSTGCSCAWLGTTACRHSGSLV